MTRFSLPLMVLWLGISAVHAQAPFSIPLRVTDGVDTVTLSFGVAPYVHFCVVESDSIDGLAEYFLPPGTSQWSF